MTRAAGRAIVIHGKRSFSRTCPERESGASIMLGLLDFTHVV
jgi:hypothetical protein